MNKNILMLNAYIASFLDKYYLIRQEVQNRHAYRIADTLETPTGETVVNVYIVGSGKYLQLTPEELANDDQMIEGFSKKDIRTITYLACQNINKPKYRIVNSTFCEKFEKIIFNLKKIDADKLISKSAEEISLDQSIISNMSIKDGYRIGYAYGSESVLQEQGVKLQLKKLQRK